MPRSFAWGPKTPTGTCAVGLINGRVAVTRLLPQVNTAPSALLLPSCASHLLPSTAHSHSAAAPRRRIRRDAAKRSALAFCALLGLEL